MFGAARSIHRIEDAGQQTEADAVAQFRVIKAKGTNLFEHGSSVDVAL
jgi:hypothetical protein